MTRTTETEEKSLSKIVAVKCEVFSRVVGYYRPVEHWNKGKQEEFRERVTHMGDDVARAVTDGDPIGGENVRQSHE